MPPAMAGAMTRTMIPEDQLCLLLARGHLTPELRSRSLDFLATSLRRPLILERAYSHQVYPLLYRNLRDLGFPGVPDPIVRDGWGISFLLELHCGGEPWPKDL